MKNFLKNMFLFMLAVSLTNCHEEISQQIQTNNKKTEKVSSKFSNTTNSSSVVDFDKSNYQGQLQYLKGEQDDINQFKIDNDIDKKIDDTSYDWEYFDSLYKSDLNITQKQYLSYIILSKKDLLGNFNDNPSQIKAEAILKYTNILVDSNYLGFCLLFNSLKTLKDQSYITVNYNLIKQNILNYAISNQFHQNAIQHLTNKTDPRSIAILKKIKEDFDFLAEIQNL